MKSLCSVCKTNEATLLCDFHIGGEWTGDVRHGFRVCCRDPDVFTCDRPLCDACAECRSIIFDIRGRGKHDTRDFCPSCAKLAAMGVNLMEPISRDEAQQKRMMLWNGVVHTFGPLRHVVRT